MITKKKSRMFNAIIIIFLGLSVWLSVILDIPTKVEAANTLYRDREHAFRIEVPDTWKRRKPKGPNVVLVAADNSGASLNIIVKSMPPNTLDSYSKLSDNELKTLALEMSKKLKEVYPDLVVNQGDSTYLNNRKALRIIWTGTHRFLDSAHRLTSYVLQVIEKGSHYTLTCTSSAEEFKRYRPICETMFNSFILEHGFYPEKKISILPAIKKPQESH